MAEASDIFTTTHWTRILAVQEGNDSQRRKALARISEQYWKPVYSYLLRRGHEDEAAKDLTQGFFADVVLDWGLVQKADRSKGRFRTFLLTALNHYVASIYRRNNRKRRMPSSRLVSLEGIASSRIGEVTDGDIPPEVSTRVWASLLLHETLREVEKKCKNDGKASHWAVFDARVLRPILDGAKTVSRTELCSRYGIDGPPTASHMIVTVIRRLQRALRAKIRQCVDSDAEVEEEIQEIMRILSNGK